MRCYQSSLALLLCAGTPALAQDMPTQALSYGVELALGSGHADRGFIISDRPVVQPVTWVDWNHTQFSLWSSFTTTAMTDGSRPRIVELELEREYAWGRFTIGPAVRMYFYHDSPSAYSERSVEGWLYVSYNAGPVRLFTYHSLDVLTYKGAYFVDAGIESEHHISAPVVVGGSLRAGWASARFNDAYAGLAARALDRVRAAAWLTASVKHLYVGPLVEFGTIVDRAVRAQTFRPTYLLVRLAMGSQF